MCSFFTFQEITGKMGTHVFDPAKEKNKFFEILFIWDTNIRPIGLKMGLFFSGAVLLWGTVIRDHLPVTHLSLALTSESSDLNGPFLSEALTSVPFDWKIALSYGRFWHQIHVIKDSHYYLGHLDQIIFLSVTLTLDSSFWIWIFIIHLTEGVLLLTVFE